MEESQNLEQVEKKRGFFSYFGQIFRIIFYLTIIYVVWLIGPKNLAIETLQDIAEIIGTGVLILTITYILFSPDPDEYENWGRFGIWILGGVGILYVITVLG